MRSFTFSNYCENTNFNFNSLKILKMEDIQSHNSKMPYLFSNKQLPLKELYFFPLNTLINPCSTKGGKLLFVTMANTTHYRI